MTTQFDTVIRGATVVGRGGEERLDIGIRDGRIAALGALSPDAAAAIVDAQGLHALPGCIDLQVHFREPGMTHKEDIESGSRAAILGGVTCVMESANTSPPVADAAGLETKIALAEGRLHCDAAFAFAATVDNLDLLAGAEATPGCAGIEIFMSTTTGGIVVDDDALINAIFRRVARRVMVHVGDESRLNARAAEHIRPGDVRSHGDWRDPRMACIGLERVVAAARRHGKRVHVMGVSSAEECALLARSRDVATGDVTINHLAFAAPGVYDRFDVLALMNPPIRGEEHRSALWDALNAGVIDAIGTDHAPHLPEEKQVPYPKGAAGIPGVQTSLPFMLTAVAQGRITLGRAVAALSSTPAAILGFEDKGEIAVGKHADIVLVDLGRTWRVDETWLRSRCGWSLFDGEDFTGRIEATFLRGQLVASGGETVLPPQGRTVGR
ncbi:MAG: dihydroorotase [Aquamicrobium sp.]|uniref:dihydroorotase n=1 Tax=Aquamicrobium sp. TaxID=1872579 RepID=UPI00349EEFB1|nr:dihydroorotase [Aquamicrobium sp.]